MYKGCGKRKVIILSQQINSTVKKIVQNCTYSHSMTSMQLSVLYKITRYVNSDFTLNDILRDA